MICDASQSDVDVLPSSLCDASQSDVDVLPSSLPEQPNTCSVISSLTERVCTRGFDQISWL